eukprot:142649_1
MADDEKVVSKEDVPCLKRWKRFGKIWAKSLWSKKSIYISVVPHLFDQATDIGVLYTYYEIWQKPSIYKEENEKIKMSAIFYSSIAVIILHKIISCGAIYGLTKRISDVFLQFIDVMMVKAIYVNYKLNTDQPGAAQRYLQILEATFESGPQLLISILFITKTYDPNVAIDPIILLSIIASIWTLTSRVTSDDKLILYNSWKEPLLSDYKFPYIHYINWRYVFRVICWRFCEISSRVFVLVLFWITMGGFALIIIMLIELTAAIILWSRGEGVIILGNMMYFTVASAGNIDKRILTVAVIYKFISPLIFLTLITISCTVPFEAWKIDDYPIRHTVIEEPFKLTILIYSWVSTIISLCSAIYIITHAASDEVSTLSARECQSLFENGQITELVNLLEFGAPVEVEGLLQYAVENADEEPALLNCMINMRKNATPIFKFALQHHHLDVLKLLLKKFKRTADAKDLDELIKNHARKPDTVQTSDSDSDLDSIENIKKPEIIYRRKLKPYIHDEMNVKVSHTYPIMDLLKVTENDKYMNWCLESAIRHRKFDIITFLVTKTNVNVHKIDSNGQTILFKLIQGWEDRLQNHDRDIDMHISRKNASIFQGQTDLVNLFEYLVDKLNVDVNIVDNKGRTCLFKLAKISNPDTRSSGRMKFLQKIIETKNAEWIMTDDSNQTIPGLVNEWGGLKYFKNLHKVNGQYTHKELLRLWGLRKYVDNFEENGFDDINCWDDLIDYDNWKKILDNSNIHQMFVTKYKTWLKVKNDTDLFFQEFYHD